MFRPIDYNALGREFRPGKPLSTEIIVDGEGPKQSHEQFVLLMAECALFVIIKRTCTLIKEDEEILLNFQTTL